MSELERRIDEAVEVMREAGRAHYNPTLARLRHTTNAEHDAVVAAGAYRKPLAECRCYPLGWLRHFTREECIELVAQHRMGCPLYVDKTPLYSRRGDTIQPSYTLQHQRRDEDAERQAFE